MDPLFQYKLKVHDVISLVNGGNLISSQTMREDNSGARACIRYTGAQDNI